MERMIMDCINYIETQLKSDSELTDLATKYHYSPFHFYRLFKEMTGFTLASYIRQRKLCHTLYDISQGAAKEQTALDYGFKNYSGFYRAFTQLYGCSPKTTLRYTQLTNRFVQTFLKEDK